MGDSDKIEFATLMSGVSEIYGKEISSVACGIFFTALAKHTIDDVSKAISMHVQNEESGRFFPKPADILKYLSTTGQEATKQAENAAAIAWATVIGEISSTGTYGTLNLKDKQALAVIKSMGGWVKLCSTPESKIEWSRKEFLSLYETFNKTPLEQLPNNLPGIEDLSNHKKDNSNKVKSLLEQLESKENEKLTKPKKLLE